MTKPTKPLSVDELIDQIGNKYLETINLSDMSWHDYKQEAKAHLIELVEKTAHDISLVDAGIDAIGKAHNKGIENMKQALIKAIKGGGR